MTHTEIIQELYSAAADQRLSEKWRATLFQAAQLLDTTETISETDVKAEAGKFAMKLEGTPVEVSVEFIPRLLRSQGFEAGMRQGLEKRGVRIMNREKIKLGARDSWIVEREATLHGKAIPLNAREAHEHAFELGVGWAFRENIRRYE